MDIFEKANDFTITIPVERYDELVTLESRMKTLVEMIDRDGYAITNNVLLLIGTDYAWDVAYDIKKRDEEKSRKLEESAKARELKELNKSYQAQATKGDDE